MSPDLDRLGVLMVDCQTTGATPDRGDLIEIGWGEATASDYLSRLDRFRSCLVRLPEGVSIPPAVRRLTGIDGDDMSAAIDREEAWSRLESAGRSVAGGSAPPVAVIHYARFEEPFLRDLWRESGGVEEAFPFQILCTHEIARRLMPDLPRRGLRALAGYLGEPMPEEKRAGPHACATARVWAGLVRRLGDDENVKTLADLRRFLRRPVPARGKSWSFPLARERRLSLPASPGVYRFLGGGGKVLYIGKAGSLKNRVNSYYRKRRAGEKHLELVSQVIDVETTVTGTALEAALIEAEEIRRLGPPYNRALRDRGRPVWFFSNDLLGSSEHPDPDHPVGPLSRQEDGRCVAALFCLLVSKDPPFRGNRETARRLGLGPVRFEPGALSEGLRIFRERNGLTGEIRSPASLLSAGASIWMRRVDAGVTPDVEDSGRERAAAGRDRARPVDGEEAARLFEEIAARCARLVLRARWLALLSESTIRWRGEREKEGDVAWVLFVERGEVSPVRLLGEGEDPPPPAGAGRSRDERLSLFDRAAHDRLRVLSTEIRRLVSAGREVEVVLGEGRALDTHSLRMLYRMI